jgi:hypothetical protein
MQININSLEIAIVLASGASFLIYNSLIKPAIVVAKMTYENGYSIKNFSALL